MKLDYRAMSGHFQKYTYWVQNTMLGTEGIDLFVHLQR